MKTVIEMAREAGFTEGELAFMGDNFIRLVELVRADERARMAEQPAQQEPVAWGIIASNTGRICQVELDADEVEGHNPKHIVPLYTKDQL